MTHPLHPKLIDALSEYKTCPEAMQAAADWQLEQVMKWIDKNISNYTDDDYLGDCEPLHKLQDDLKKAMRPQENN
tara:strand:+ start:877 stop:1101 length:225 start_codon:yes stop_codon:yes gene_type:complete